MNWLKAKHWQDKVAAAQARSVEMAYLHDDEGQGLAEYALILSMVAALCIAALVALGGTAVSLIDSPAGSF